LLIARRESGEVLDLVLDAANHHQPMSGAIEEIDLPAGDSFSQELREITAEADEHRVITLSSRVVAKNTESSGHLQMLDFRIRPNEENEQLAVDIIRRVVEGGILLNSGNSYHFYGYRLMRTDAELSSFLGRVSLFAPFIDQRWVAHQLIEGACALRVSKGKSFERSPLFIRDVQAP
jgi:hypothetical protein